jgi:hypothetical protein
MGPYRHRLQWEHLRNIVGNLERIGSRHYLPRAKHRPESVEGHANGDFGVQHRKESHRNNHGHRARLRHHFADERVGECFDRQAIYGDCNKRSRESWCHLGSYPVGRGLHEFLRNAFRANGHVSNLYSPRIGSSQPVHHPNRNVRARYKQEGKRDDHRHILRGHGERHDNSEAGWACDWANSRGYGHGNE